MIFYEEYNGHYANIVGDRKKIDNTIYTFDIETTSYIIIDGKQLAGIEYINLTKDEQERAIFKCCMYIWMFSINDTVYYGRTWEQFKKFLDKLELYNGEKKIVFIHNLAFEFQFLKGVFNFTDVLARKKHKVMQCFFSDYNIELRCTYMMSNCALKYLPKIFNLPVEKQVGELDYTLIRTPITTLSNREMKYCENDCLVIYYYIQHELETYERVDKIPLTATGHVRRELKNIVLGDWNYRAKVKKAINTNPHIYNLLQDAFSGGYTHANWVYTDEIIENVDSYDFTSSYPYILVTHKFPSEAFKKCSITKIEQMSKRFAYLLVVKFTNIKCKYYNNFISTSKCRNIVGGRYDNGRIIQAESLEITLTDVDFYFILSAYDCNYDILEIYYAKYDYLPKQFIEFVLEKYVNKTQFKNVKGKEVEYAKEKNKFNSLYGMSVTNLIRDEVVFNNKTGWSERTLTNEEIIEKLEIEKKKSFLSFAYGVWVTAYARSNLLKNVLKLDEFVVYCDTDCVKLKQGYNKKIITNYNEFVESKIKFVSKKINIPLEKFAPSDVFGKKHMLGLFEFETENGYEHTYNKFITQGAKKYAYEINGQIGITVAGVPKQGAKALKSLSDFKDNFVFNFKDTNKNLVFYCENQDEFNLIDYNGKSYNVKDNCGCCLIPTTYVLGKSLDYANLICENSSARARFKE